MTTGAATYINAAVDAAVASALAKAAEETRLLVDAAREEGRAEMEATVAAAKEEAKAAVVAKEAAEAALEAAEIRHSAELKLVIDNTKLRLLALEEKLMAKGNETGAAAAAAAAAATAPHAADSSAADVPDLIARAQSFPSAPPAAKPTAKRAAQPKPAQPATPPVVPEPTPVPEVVVVEEGESAATPGARSACNACRGWHRSHSCGRAKPTGPKPTAAAATVMAAERAASDDEAAGVAAAGGKRPVPAPSSSTAPPPKRVAAPAAAPPTSALAPSPAREGGIKRKCSFCLTAKCVAPDRLHKCSKGAKDGCDRCWSDRCISLYAGDPEERACLYHVRCAKHGAMNCEACADHCRERVESTPPDEE
jgi:hypothetical protein